MSKRGDNIHKRKDGRWEGRYIQTRDASGKAKYASVYGKTYKEVKQKLVACTKNPPQCVKSTAGKNMPFHELLRLWMGSNQIRLKGATTRKYQYLIDTHIVPSLGNLPVSQITALSVNAFLAEKLRHGRLDQTGGLSSSYVRSIMLIISSALKFAVSENLCEPLRTPIYKPACEKKELPILSKEEQRKLEGQLLQELNLTGLGVLLSLHTGLRIGEVCALAWDDIDFKERVLHVRSTVARIRNETSESPATRLVIDKPKTQASLRDIPISSVVFPALLHIRESTASQYVISDGYSFISPRTYEYRYHKLLTECGIADINYHALRHTFATRCVEAGVDVKTLSEILGHANASITLNTYVHSSMELKRRQLEKLALLPA